MAAAIWVDADACPGLIRDVLCRAAERTATRLTFIANRALQVPRSPWIAMFQVARGFDAADRHIISQVAAGDLVITADIPLAAAVIARGASALNPRGEVYDCDNIPAVLALRNFMDTLRSSGVHTGGPSALGHGDRHAFAAALDRWCQTSKNNQ